MKLAAICAGILVVALVAFSLYARFVMNPGVMRELREAPDGERARKVMIITLPSGKQIPVNYLHEGNLVYAGADYPWWRELTGAGAPVELLLRGRDLTGHARAVEDDDALRTDVFARLRPTAPLVFGTLVVVELDGDGAG